MGDGVDGDVIGLLDLEDGVREGLAKVPSHGVGHDAIKARGGANVRNQPVDFIVQLSGQSIAFLSVKRERLGKILLSAFFKKPRFHRPMS